MRLCGMAGYDVDCRELQPNLRPLRARLDRHLGEHRVPVAWVAGPIVLVEVLVAVMEVVSAIVPVAEPVT